MFDIIDTITASHDKLQRLSNDWLHGNEFVHWTEGHSWVEEIIDEAHAVLIPAQKGISAFSI